MGTDHAHITQLWLEIRTSLSLAQHPTFYVLATSLLPTYKYTFVSPSPHKSSPAFGSDLSWVGDWYGRLNNVHLELRQRYPSVFLGPVARPIDCWISVSLFSLSWPVLPSTATDVQASATHNHITSSLCGELGCKSSLPCEVTFAWRIDNQPVSLPRSSRPAFREALPLLSFARGDRNVPNSSRHYLVDAPIDTQPRSLLEFNTVRPYTITRDGWYDDNIHGIGISRPSCSHVRAQSSTGVLSILPSLPLLEFSRRADGQGLLWPRRSMDTVDPAISLVAACLATLGSDAFSPRSYFT